MVILSAGTLGSPIILERSGIGSTEVLKKIGVGEIACLPGVGENFQGDWFYDKTCADGTILMTIHLQTTS